MAARTQRPQHSLCDKLGSGSCTGQPVHPLEVEGGQEGQYGMVLPLQSHSPEGPTWGTSTCPPSIPGPELGVHEETCAQQGNLRFPALTWAWLR